MERVLLRPPKLIWPPNYTEQFKWRESQVLRLRKDPKLIYGAKEFYKQPENCVRWIEDWGITYDPRNAGTDLPSTLPFILFPKQKELVQFLIECWRDSQPGLVEKSRDMGATWLCVAFSVWLWLYYPGTTVGWSSRHKDLVDKIGIMDSIFEKLRFYIRWLPRELMPEGFDYFEHIPYTRIINPENNNTISGEIGDNTGRGGRTRIMFLDEFAHYIHQEMVEAAVMENTRAPVYISSVHGLGNVFHRKRESGTEWYPGVQLLNDRKTRVFVMDWRDHPAKTPEWYNTEKKAKENEGLQHVFAQEVDRKYDASVIGTIIPAEWVKASIDAHKVLKFKEDGGWCAGLDVADEGTDRNALAKRRGIILRSVEEWGERGPAKTTRKAIDDCRNLGVIELFYDAIGIGVSVKEESNRLEEEGLLPQEIRFVPWVASFGPLDPDKNVIRGDKRSPLNKDFYENLKAQAWWNLRLRFERTWRALNEPDYTWDENDLISIDSNIPMLRKLEKELSQPTIGQSSKLRLIVNKKPDGTPSPNMADAVVMCYWPVPWKKPMIISDELLARMAADTNRGY